MLLKKEPILFQAEELTEQEMKVIMAIDETRKSLRYSLANPKRWKGLLRRNMFARAIRGSNSIEGYNVTAEDAIAAVEGEEPLDAQKETWLAVTGYRSAMTFVLQLARDPSFRYNEGFLRSLHFMMLQHDLSNNPGNWRPGSIFVKDESKKEIVYEGPDVELVPSLIDALIEWLNGNDKMPTLVRGAMAHLNLVMIHPFSDGNGRMARCLQTLVLSREGILEPEFCSIEEYLGRNTQDYYAVLGETAHGSWSPRNSTRPWIKFSLTAHYRQAQTLLMRTRLMNRLWEEMESIIATIGLPSRVIYALSDAAVGYRVRNASYRNIAEISDVLASRDLKAAVDVGLLNPEGERRGRGYSGGTTLRELFIRIRQEEFRPIPDPFVPVAETGELPFPPIANSQ